MADIRIPVSLKVDDSSDIYFSLIEPLREDRNLSGFIMLLFKLYLNNEDFKKIVDNSILGYDTKEKIESHLKSIAQLHGDNVRAIEDFEEDVLKEEASKAQTATTPDITARLSALEQSVQNLVQGLQNGNNMLYYGMGASPMQMGMGVAQMPFGNYPNGVMGMPMAQMPIGGQNGAMGASNAVGGNPNGVKNGAVTGAVNGDSVDSDDSSNVGIKVNQDITSENNLGLGNGGTDSVGAGSNASPVVENEPVEEDASDDLMKFMSSI